VGTGTNGNISADPLFVAGGYRLQEGSPCVDAGDDYVLTLLPVDLDGRPRRIGPHVDMGAFETPYLSLISDALDALRAAAGLWSPAAGDLPRLDVENGSSSGRVDLLDAVRLFRRAVGPGGP
jgi:hypothetical protein